jgi:hypothetical protein
MDHHDLMSVNLEQLLSPPDLFSLDSSEAFRRVPNDVDYEESAQRYLQRYLQCRTKASETRKLRNLCEYCVSIRLPSRKSKHARIIYSRNIGEMNQAAKGQSRCALCSFLMWPIDFLAESAERNKESLFSMRTTGYPTKRRDDPSSTLLDTTELRQVDSELSYDEKTIAIVKYDICRLATDPTASDFSIFAGKYPEAHLSKPVARSRARYRPRIVNSDPLSEATIGLIKDWLSACRIHSSCKEQKPRPLPTRVLDVRSENPKIVDGEGLHGLYVTLSHCWGSGVDTFSPLHKTLEIARPWAFNSPNCR